MDPIIKKAYEAAQKGQSYAFATVIEATLKGTPRKAGAKMVVLTDGSCVGTIGGGRKEKAVILECQKALKNGRPSIVTYDYFGKEGQSVCGGQMKVLIEPFAGQKHFVICGAGHIALPLSVIGKMLNFKVSIVDNRPEFADKKRFPHVDHIYLGSHVELFKKIKIDKNCYVMIITQGFEYDFNCLEFVLKSKAAYIGFISSKVKKIKFIRRLREKKFSEKSIQKIYAPMGFSIGAQTPEEIAVAIAAQMIAHQHKCLDGSLKYDYKY